MKDEVTETKSEVGSRKSGIKSPVRSTALGAAGSDFALPTSPFRLSSPAFSLVEIVLALGLFSFVVLAILGTITVALNSTRDSEMKLGAAHAATSLIETLKSNPRFQSNNPTFPIQEITNGMGTATVANIYVDRQGRTTASNNAQFLLNYRITGDTNSTNLYYCFMELQWPPIVAATNIAGSYRITTSVLLP